ncbi:MAG: protein kinase [Fuerstiella sp.]|nr:hypothetical protein [Fuerstiella sp.]
MIATTPFPYLKDAADALDFMSEQHGLQHLDIKPDNLLLQGNHAKVGDFGLAKDLNSANVSLVNGFTPLYAAPEIFEGRTGRGSDQYSLAIVYQMMLTGQPPFNGRTAAQLTAQHLRSQPDLIHLQPIDRPVVARALSKNQNSRYENCRQFVEELQRRRTSRLHRSVVPPNDPYSNGELNRTDPLQTPDGDDGKTVGHVASTSIPINAVDPAECSLRPVVFVGVGGIAGHILQQLKNKFVSNGRDADVFRFLQIDTDREALQSLRHSDGGVGLSAEETVAIPLRTATAYRSARELDLSWMSRRWCSTFPGRVRWRVFDHSAALRCVTIARPCESRLNNSC